MTIRDKDNLNLPDAPDFISEPPQYSMAEMFALCEPMLPFWNKLRYRSPRPRIVGEAFQFKEENSSTSGTAKVTFGS